MYKQCSWRSLPRHLAAVVLEGLRVHRDLVPGKKPTFRIAAISCTALLLSAVPSRASVLLTISQSGSDVVAVGAGTLNTTSLGFLGNNNSGGFVTPSTAMVGVGVYGTNNLYQGYTGPTTFGSGGIVVASSASGDIFGIEGAVGNFLIAPGNYVSGAALSGSATWNNTTISGLGLTPGDYLWTWGNGSTSDFLEVVINGTSSAPEPGSITLASSAIGALGFGAWIRRRRPRRGAPPIGA